MQQLVSCAAAVVLAVAPSLALAQSAPAQKPSASSASVPAAFSRPPLPYAANALEPAIDAQTMSIHHGKHHQAYVDALNKAVAQNPALAGQTLEQLLAKAGTLPAAVRNNAGGHWNHSFFWQSMTPAAQSGEPSSALAAAITEKFGSMDGFKTAFKNAGTGRFGSGWVWLIVNADGQLEITTTPNQDNPLMDVASSKGTPLLGNDLWEHAYYLKYQNRRADYLDSWWPVVNWKVISERFAQARADQ